MHCTFYLLSLVSRMQSPRGQGSWPGSFTAIFLTPRTQSGTQHIINEDPGNELINSLKENCKRPGWCCVKAPTRPSTESALGHFQHSYLLRGLWGLACPSSPLTSPSCGLPWATLRMGKKVIKYSLKQERELVSPPNPDWLS